MLAGVLTFAVARQGPVGSLGWVVGVARPPMTTSKTAWRSILARARLRGLELEQPRGTGRGCNGSRTPPNTDRTGCRPCSRMWLGHYRRGGPRNPLRAGPRSWTIQAESGRFSTSGQPADESCAISLQVGLRWDPSASAMVTGDGTAAAVVHGVGVRHGDRARGCRGWSSCSTRAAKCCYRSHRSWIVTIVDRGDASRSEGGRKQ